MISLTTKPLTAYNIGDEVKTPIRSDWYNSIFSKDEKMEKSTTFIASFLNYSLPPYIQILHRTIYFRVKTTDIEN